MRPASGTLTTNQNKCHGGKYGNLRTPLQHIAAGFLAMLAFTALLLLPARGTAETRLSGELDVSRFDSTGNPYIVESDIIIPSGQACTIEAGTVFLFSPFTGLTVEGTLKVDGTFEKPVVFSSINNMLYNPASVQNAQPFDWNGVTVVADSRETIFKSLHLCHSVYGIKSQTPYISISQSMFYQNGQYHFTIKNKIQSVQDNIPYSYNDTTTVITDGASGKSGGKGLTAIVPPPEPPAKNHRTGGAKVVLRVGSLVVGMLGAAGGVLAYREVEAADLAIAEMKPQNINPATGTLYLRSEVENERARRKLLSAGSIGGFILGGIGLAGFTLTFIF